MDKFTFITISFNHESYIIEHLESIKNIIVKYASGIDVSIIISDDGSKDNTINKAKAWLSSNKPLFSDVQILSDGINRGTVQNLLKAINALKTDSFKFLAGDDKYLDNNIFKLFDYPQKSLIITPVMVFGADKIRRQEQFDKKFCLIDFLHTTERIKQLIQVNNYFPAPGVFINGNELRNKVFQEYLLQFKYIEDYPMWYYLLTQCDYNVEVINEPFIAYRAGSGISTSGGQSNLVYLQENAIVMKKLDAKIYKYPKLINPYRYFIKLLYFIIAIVDRLR